MVHCPSVFVKQLALNCPKAGFSSVPFWNKISTLGTAFPSASDTEAVSSVV